MDEAGTARPEDLPPERPASRQPVRRNRHIYDVLRDNIEGGRLEPGLLLTESALSRHFGVSRAPAADALARLLAEGLVARHDGRGFLVGGGDGMPVRKSLAAAGLTVPASSPGSIALRGWREALYPTVETEIAGCISYGSFGVAGAAMAKHFGVSRTVIQEVLSRLERVGLLEQGQNGRWVAPRLTVEGARDHYQMRRLLEPVALLDAATRLGPGPVRAARARIAGLRGAPIGIAEINAVEDDLHRRLVGACGNGRMRDTITRSQLPLIATHMAFNRYLQAEEMGRVLDDHDAVLAALEAGEGFEAGGLLAAHLDHGLRTTARYLDGDPEPPPGLIPPYMTRID